MSTQNDAAKKAFEQLEQLERRNQQEKMWRRMQQQHQMEKDLLNSPYQQSQFELSYTMDLKKEMDKRDKQAMADQLKMQRLNTPEKKPKDYREMAEQVRCARCLWKDPEGCWECSGTGITPIPFAEVMSGERGKEEMPKVGFQKMTTPQYSNMTTPYYSDTMKVAGKGAYFK